jgi:hypothetical protein
MLIREGIPFILIQNFLNDLLSHVKKGEYYNCHCGYATGLYNSMASFVRPKLVKQNRLERKVKCLQIETCRTKSLSHVVRECLQKYG